MVRSDPGGKLGIPAGIAILRPAPPRPIVVTPARLTPVGLLLALGVPLAGAGVLAHFGELHRHHLSWILGGLALMALLSIAFSTSLTFERGVVHLRTRLLGVLVRDRPLISDEVLESIVVRGLPSVGLGGTSQYQLLLIGGGAQQTVGPFESKQRASEARLAILSGLAASRA